MRSYIVIVLMSASLVHASDTLKDVEKSFQNKLKRMANEEKEWEEDRKYQKFVDSEQFKKIKQENNFPLFHSITAAISFIDTSIELARNDEKNNYEWTKINASFDVAQLSNSCDKPLVFANVLELSGVKYSQVMVDIDYHLEVERQRLIIELLIFKKIIYFWYKIIFPLETIISFNHNSAVNLNHQINFVYQLNKLKIKSISEINRITLTNSYYELIDDLLGKIKDSLPTEFAVPIVEKRNVNLKKTYKKLVREKFLKNDEVVNKFKNIYAKIFRLSNAINDDILMLNRDFKMITEDSLIGRLKSNFYDLRHCALNFNDTTVKFNFPFNPLDLVKLRSKIYLVELEKIENNCESIQEKECLLKIDCPSIPNINEPNDEKESVESFGPLYFEQINEFHENRKREQQSHNIRNKINKLSDYEISLFSFLKDNIYHCSKLNKRQFKKELSDVKFVVEQNRKGNGAAYHVSPTSDNPMFKDSENLKNAFFTMHLPHKNNVIINIIYLKFAQTGFTSKFGLSLDYIEQKLNSQKNCK